MARQFVERLAKQRNITLPTGDIFAETPAPKGKKPAPAKAAEPPKPAAAVLPPPRLVKTVRHPWPRPSLSRLKLQVGVRRSRARRDRSRRRPKAGLTRHWSKRSPPNRKGR